MRINRRGDEITIVATREEVASMAWALGQQCRYILPESDGLYSAIVEKIPNFFPEFAKGPDQRHEEEIKRKVEDWGNPYSPHPV